MNFACCAFPAHPSRTHPPRANAPAVKVIYTLDGGQDASSSSSSSSYSYCTVLSERQDVYVHPGAAGAGTGARAGPSTGDGSASASASASGSGSRGQGQGRGGHGRGRVNGREADSQDSGEEHGTHGTRSQVQVGSCCLKGAAWGVCFAR